MATALREGREQKAEVRVPTTPDRVRLELGGMTCASCASRIERKLNKLEGVEASVNFATEEAAVAFDGNRFTVADLIKTVEDTGYTAALPHAGADKDGDPTRPLRIRLTVAIVLSVPLVAMAMVLPARFAVNPFKNRWILVSAALRRGDDFGMVPPI